MTIERLRAIHEAATPGRWDAAGQVISAGRHRLGDTQDNCCFGHSGQECSDDEMEAFSLDDATAIVTEHNTYAALLDCAELLRETAEVAHRTDSIRSHADPNVKGWVVGPIETCDDLLCRDALTALDRLDEVAP